jgi:PAS domain S-box-containing protein
MPATGVVAQQEAQNKRILILFNNDSYTATQTDIDRALRSTLKNGSSVPVETYSEYVGNTRAGTGYEKEFVALLQRKYQGKKFDVIISVGQFPLSTLLRNRAELFPDTPIVSVAIDQRAVADLYPAPCVTGVWGEINFRPNLDLALALHPRTKHVAVIQGVSDTDKAWADRAKEDFREYGSSLEFSDLTGLTVPEMRSALAGLPPDTIVFFISNVRDKAGNTYESPEYLRQVSDASAAPIYGTTDGQLGNGIVGGKLLSFEALGTEAGRVTLHLLAGESSDSVAPHMVSSPLVFDWRQLQRWGISETSLPEGSVVRFKQPTAWEEYKWYAIGLLAAVTVETILLGFLIYLRFKKRQAEAEAERLSGRITEIVANVPGIVWETRIDPATKQRRTTFISDYVQTMLGYTPDEWMRQPPGLGFRIVADDDREQAKRDSETVMKSGESGVSEFRWLTKGGQIRWIENHLIPIKENGNVIGMRGVALDVTNRKLAEEQARRTEEKDKALLSALPDMMFLQSLNGDYLDFHATDVNNLLMPPESFLGKNVRDVMPPDLAEQFLACFERVEEGKAPQILEYKLNIDGIERWYEARMVRTGDKILSIVREITERVLARLTLQESEARFRNMAETAPVMIWMSDETQATTYVNKQWLDMTGSTLEQETDLGWTRHLHPDDVEKIVQTGTAAFEKRIPFNLEFRIQRADGQYRWVLSSGTPRFAPNRDFVGFIGTTVDITEIKESERQLREAHDELNALKNQLEAENIYLQEELRQDQASGDIVGQSAAIKYVLFKIQQVAPTDTTVLITGETGTGKELVAHAIHQASLRKDRPLIKVNCAALSPSLIESELFGHEKGAFTGAGARRLGRFELANTGTLFLDEIGELPLDLQGKLLRVIQEGEFERVGSGKTITTDVRIIASTNRNLKKSVEAGKFREDLWYRLNVFPITTPPLRERRDDIPILTEYFARRFARKLGKAIEAVSPDSMNELVGYSWPGNVRELANVIERAVINSRGPVLRIHEDFATHEAEVLAASVKTLEELERDYIVQVLEDLNWKIDGPNGAARVLGINPSTLRSRIAKLEIKKPSRERFAPSSQIH